MSSLDGLLLYPFGLLRRFDATRSSVVEKNVNYMAVLVANSSFILDSFGKRR